METPAAATLPGGYDLDVEILRVMYTPTGVSIAGIDPRLNASRVAHHLGVSRSRIAARLRAWTEYGFLRRYDVWPNPYLFGLTGATFDVRVDDALAKDEVIGRIGLVPGAVGGIEFLGSWLAATFVFTRDEEPRRVAALLRGLAGVAQVGDATPWAAYPYDRTLSPLELRIVRVLRQYPTDSLASIARHVGVSTRTITARYRRLIDERAVWFVPVLDFRALAEPVLALNLEFRSAPDREAFARALRRRYPRSLAFGRIQFGPALPDTIGAYFVVVPSAARVEEFEAWVRANPGIVAQETLTMKQTFSYPETFDRLLAGRSGPRGSVPADRRLAATENEPSTR